MFMVELKTPFEFIEELVDTIEKTRKRKQLRQQDLCDVANLSIATYQKFIYQKKISLISLVQILYALDMIANLEGLITYDEIQSLDDIRAVANKNPLPKRVRK
jgi:transcriptional regulator with XRE-family HTH domain